MLPHCDLLTMIRERLAESLPSTGAPDKDWCRGYAEYRSGFRVLVEEQRSRDQMVLMARNKSEKPMDESEYLTQMADMMVEAITTVSDDTLRGEIRRRGMKVPP